MQPHELSYDAMTLDNHALVLSRETKRALRHKQGLCLTCQGVPTQLYDICKSRFNPLRMRKYPRTVEGESLNGQCLICNPSLRSSFKRTPGRGKIPSTGGSATSVFSDPGLRTLSEPQHSEHSVLRNSINVIPVGEIDTRSQADLSVTSASTTDDSTEESSESEIHTNSSRSSEGQSSKNIKGRGSFCLPDVDDDPRPSATRKPCVVSERKESVVSERKEESDRVMEELAVLIKDLECGSDCIDLLVEVLLNYMVSYHQFEKVQQFCLRKISAACKDDANSSFSSLILSGGHKCIMLAMTKHPSSFQIQAHGVAIFSALSTKESSRKILAEDGACECIVQAVDQHIDEKELVFEGLQALLRFTCSASTALTQGPGPSKDFCWLPGCHRVCLKSMRRYPSSVTAQREGCALLSRLEAVSPAPETDQETLEAVVRAVRCHLDQPSVVASACSALRDVTLNESSCRRLRQVEGILNLLRDASGGFSPESSSVDDVDLVLQRLETSEAQDQFVEQHVYESLLAMVAQQPRNPRVVQEVMDILETFDWSTKIVAACLMVIQKLAGLSSSLRDSVVEQTLKRNLIDLVAGFPDDVRVQEQAQCLFEIVAEKSLARAN